MVGTPEARKALERAADDKTAAVKGAVRVALRYIDTDSDERLMAAGGEPPIEPVKDPVDLDLDFAPGDAADREGTS